MSALIQIRESEGFERSAEEKEKLLFARLSELLSVIIALSGGADSAYLAWAARETLGSKALSVTALSASFSAHDRAMLERFVDSTGVHHEFIVTQEMEN